MVQVNLSGDEATITGSLTGLPVKTLKMKDESIFTKCFEMLPEEEHLWAYHFPYLYAYSLSPYREITFIEQDDVLYSFVYSKMKKRLDMYFIPMPPTEESLKYGFSILRKANKDKSGRVLYSPTFQLPTKNYKVTRWDYDYIYCRENFELIKKLRWQIKTFMKHSNHILREYRPEDAKPCIELDKIWNKTQGVKYFRIFDRLYNKEIINLLNHDLFPDLESYVLETNNDKIEGWAVIGRLNNMMSTNIIHKTITNIQGASTYLVYKMCELTSTPFNNDNGTVGSSSLKFYKEHLKPVKKIAVYKITEKK